MLLLHVDPRKGYHCRGRIASIFAVYLCQAIARRREGADVVASAIFRLALPLEDLQEGDSDCLIEFNRVPALTVTNVFCIKTK